MWIVTESGSLINASQIEEIGSYYKDYGGYEVEADLITIVRNVPEHAAQEIVEKIALCIAHGVDMVRLTRDGDVLDMLSYSNHGTARYTQRVYLKS